LVLYGKFFIHADLYGYKGIMDFLRNFPTAPLAAMAVMLALAPFYPEPHLVEKLRMLSQGELSKGIDIFDLFLHGTPLVLLLIKLFVLKNKSGD